MASIFIRLRGKQPHFLAIYGAAPSRVNKVRNSHQKYLGKIMLDTGMVMFNKIFPEWIEEKGLGMDYIVNKLVNDAKRFDLSITIPGILINKPKNEESTPKD
ncbi:MAG: hypothetical protein LBI10_01915 [Deltaproteobacteria bacterium]|jgi:hypothetical protein|nr:hypothetical protein [Deltaproteobacteria bacterium]